MKIVSTSCLALASTAQAWNWWSTNTYKSPRPMTGSYKYSNDATNYQQERQADIYPEPIVAEKPYLINNEIVNPPTAYLQPETGLIYRHPNLDKDPEFVSLNRVNGPKTYLPPRGVPRGSFYGRNWSKPTSVKTANYGNNFWQDRSRYNTYNNGLSRKMPTPYRSTIIKTTPKPVEYVYDVVDQPIIESPEMQAKELETEIEKSMADCIGEYDSVLKKCVEVLEEKEAEVDTYRTAAAVATPATFVQAAVPEPKGPKYYDWQTRVWKNCEVGKKYNYRQKICLPEVAKQRWSWFG